MRLDGGRRRGRLTGAVHRIDASSRSWSPGRCRRRRKRHVHASAWWRIVRRTFGEPFTWELGKGSAGVTPRRRIASELPLLAQPTRSASDRFLAHRPRSSRPSIRGCPAPKPIFPAGRSWGQSYPRSFQRLQIPQRKAAPFATDGRRMPQNLTVAPSAGGLTACLRRLPEMAPAPMAKIKDGGKAPSYRPTTFRRRASHKAPGKGLLVFHQSRVMGSAAILAASAAKSTP